MFGGAADDAKTRYTKGIGYSDQILVMIAYENLLAYLT